MTAKNPLDALATLRTAANFFHLVVTDVHMPEMNGFDFQKRVQEEFHLPVVSEYCFELEIFFHIYFESILIFYLNGY